MKETNPINFCQVSLKRDIPLILKNYLNLKNFYKKIKIYIICPSKDLTYFKKTFFNNEFKIINEDDLISFENFKLIFLKFSKHTSYQLEFDNRLNWYYQQILKLSFIISFIKKKNQSITIWDADTIMIKKIIFFHKNRSIKYGTFNEFHRHYYTTNRKILKEIPKYFLSFLNQFISVTPSELTFLEKLFNYHEGYEKEIPLILSENILKSIFAEHKEYNGSMFSEYELIGHSNYLYNRSIQKPLLSLRFGLDGLLSEKQIFLAKLFNFKHVTYEHSHPNKKSLGMLDRQQSWFGLIKIMLKNIIKFYLRFIKHIYNYKKYYGKN